MPRALLFNGTDWARAKQFSPARDVIIGRAHSAVHYRGKMLLYDGSDYSGQWSGKFTPANPYRWKILEVGACGIETIGLLPFDNLSGRAIVANDQMFACFSTITPWYDNDQSVPLPEQTCRFVVFKFTICF